MNSDFIAGVQAGYTQGFLDGFMESSEDYHADSYAARVRISDSDLYLAVLRDPDWQTSRVQQMTRFLEAIGAGYSESTAGGLEMKL